MGPIVFNRSVSVIISGLIIPLSASIVAIVMGYESGGIKETIMERMLVGTDPFVYVFRPISLPCRIEKEISKEAMFPKRHILEMISQMYAD